MDQPPSENLTRIERVVRERMPPPKDGLALPVFSARVDRLLGVLEAMDGWVSEFDGQGRMLYASPNIETVLGFSAEECVGSDRIEFHPDDLPRVLHVGRRVRSTGKRATNQIRIRHKRDGR